MFTCEFRLGIKWIRGERDDFWMSPSDFRFVVTVAAFRERFGLLRGRNKSRGKLKGCRGHLNLVAHQIS